MPHRHDWITKGGNDMAEWTGLEPATPGVTGRYSNQLNYHSQYCALYSLIRDQLRDNHLPDIQAGLLVGAEGIEPPTFAL